MVIAFLNQKGGTGKTTLAVHVACELAGTGASVLLVDADTQASASEWAQLRAQPACAVVTYAQPGRTQDLYADLSAKIAAQGRRYDHIVIDGPPRGNALLRSCLAVADLCVIPIEPSGLSVRAADRIVAMADEVRAAYRPGLRVRFAVSRKLPVTRIGRDLRNLVDGPPVLETEITQRVGFAMAMTFGQTIAEREGRGHPGAVEIANLTAELLRIQPEEPTA